MLPEYDSVCYLGRHRLPDGSPGIRPVAGSRETSGMTGWKDCRVRSPQTLSEADRRAVAAWAADCAEHVLEIFEATAPSDGRPRDLIARARAFSRGELDVAEGIRRRFTASDADAAFTWVLFGRAWPFVPGTRPGDTEAKAFPLSLDTLRVPNIPVGQKVHTVVELAAEILPGSPP